jgi:hypothetical protein
MAETTRSLPEAIGEMTVLWNHCQAMIFMLFFHVLKLTPSQAQSIFFRIPSDKHQRRITAALFKELKPSALTEGIVDAIGDLNDVAENRNDFTHAMWHHPDGAEAPTIWLGMRARLRDKTDLLKECEKLIGTLEGIYARLKSFEIEMRNAPGLVQAVREQGPLVAPVRQADVQTANRGLDPQQGAPSTPVQPHQSSDQ